MAALPSKTTRLGRGHRWLLVAALATVTLSLVSAASAGSSVGGQPPAGAAPSTVQLSEQPQLQQPDGSVSAPPVAIEAVGEQPAGPRIRAGSSVEAAPATRATGRVEVAGASGADASGGRTDSGGVDGADRPGGRSD